MADSLQKDWRDLCVAVIEEKDSTRLGVLIQELVEALDRARKTGLTPLHRATQTTRGVMKVDMTICARA
jgi:hypothetical protein